MPVIFLKTRAGEMINAGEIVSMAAAFEKKRVPSLVDTVEVTRVTLRNGNTATLSQTVEEIALSCAPVTPAHPGYELLIAEQGDIQLSLPIVGWRARPDGSAEPVVVGYGGCNLSDPWLAIRMPDGRVTRIGEDGELTTEEKWLESLREKLAAE